MQALDLIGCRRSLMPTRLRAGTRNSPLALYQTRHFMRLITLEFPALLSESELAEHAMITSGDHNTDARLADIGGKGLFAKEIHEALLDNRIDCAVHSLKDLETELPHGIVLACVLAREDARDALILGPTCGPADPSAPWSAIPTGAVVGTASVRRQSQILYQRPDLRMELLRGNVRTRLNKVKEGGGVDASLLAVAGLRRLGLDGEAALILDPSIMVPAARA